MLANPDTDPELDRQYDSLTPKQQAVIDAHAEIPEETNRAKAKLAGEKDPDSDGPVNESYCSEILNKKFSELAEYRAQIEQHGQPDDSGDTQPALDGVAAVRTGRGSSGRGDSAALSRGPSGPIQVADDGDGVLMKLEYEYVGELLKRQDTQLPEELHERLVDVVVSRSFS